MIETDGAGSQVTRIYDNSKTRNAIDTDRIVSVMFSNAVALEFVTIIVSYHSSLIDLEIDL